MAYNYHIDNANGANEMKGTEAQTKLANEIIAKFHANLDRQIAKTESIIARKGGSEKTKKTIAALALAKSLSTENVEASDIIEDRAMYEDMYLAARITVKLPMLMITDFKMSRSAAESALTEAGL